MTMFQFCLWLLIDAILAFSGDNLMLRGIVDDKRGLHDIGKLLYAAGTSVILVLVVVMFTAQIN